MRCLFSIDRMLYLVRMRIYEGASMYDNNERQFFGKRQCESGPSQ